MGGKGFPVQAWVSFPENLRKELEGAEVGARNPNGKNYFAGISYTGTNSPFKFHHAIKLKKLLLL